MAAPTFQFTLITAVGRAFRGSSDSVIIPGASGLLGVLANHAPMIAGTVPGCVTIKNGASTEWFAVDDGVLEVRKNDVVLITSYAEKALNEADAKVKALAAPVNEPQ